MHATARSDARQFFSSVGYFTSVRRPFVYFSIRNVQPGGLREDLSYRTLTYRGTGFRSFRPIQVNKQPTFVHRF